MKGSKAKVLVVDDHHLIREGICSLVKDIAIVEVVGDASNGEEALVFLSENEVDVVLMDINMPQMDGITCTARISERYGSVKVLALTSLSGEHQIRMMLEAGALGYIVKDADPQELTAALLNIVAGKHYFHDSIKEKIYQDIYAISKEKSRVDINPINLTTREIEVLQLINQELSNAEIAQALSVSIRTIDAHRRNLLTKVGAKNVVGLIKYALRHDLIQ